MSNQSVDKRVGEYKFYEKGDRVQVTHVVFGEKPDGVIEKITPKGVMKLEDGREFSPDGKGTGYTNSALRLARVEDREELKRPHKRNEPLPDDFFDTFSDIHALMDGAGCWCLQFQAGLLERGYHSAFDSEVEMRNRAIEFVTKWGEGRGIEYDDYKVTRDDRNRNVHIEVRFSPVFKDGDALDEALLEDGII